MVNVDIDGIVNDILEGINKGVLEGIGTVEGNPRENGNVVSNIDEG